MEAHRPLYERVPTRDEYGKPLCDFMLILPGLRDKPRAQLQDALARLQMVLVRFHDVVFADLNLPLNLLWVSVRARPGVIVEVAAALQQEVPNALLVAEKRSP